ncbi:flagellar motor switch phosphatase FliY [Bacillus sp. ISL-18]|uniref:flagellar motor switch phosphatase FliY n=1 Tax=Bacillus sp. ISL-18 TaxID=2819118 RepID=UPI001BE9E16C|nr:flagellar motor switch phosphatase FliY [Bacillus sp. ISL-18]MBT2657798.1 flagellar motor switch phosphatase FliY [Bacillus sp. ISL-18]
MSEGSLSQEEINALFNQVETTQSLTIDDVLSAMEKDALGEIGNIALGSSTTALSTLLNQRVEITTPTLSVIEQDRLQDEENHRHVAVHVDYTVGIRGKNLLMIKENDAKIIANLMMGGDGTVQEEEISELHLSAVQEAMNQMMGSAATSMSTMLHQKVDISPPTIDLIDYPPTNLNDLEDDIIIKVSFRLAVGSLIDSNMVQLIPLSFAKEMIQQILYSGEQAAPASTTVTSSAPIMVAEQSTASVQQPNSIVQAAVMGMESAPVQTAPPKTPENANVQKVEYTTFPNTSSAAPAGGLGNLDMLYDIPLAITVELGRTEMQIRKILELGPGAVIQLEKLAGEPVDILANNKLIAKGEVVVIEENFGVRITDIISQVDRLTKMTM